MAINNANLVFNGVTEEAGSGYGTFNGRYQWEYTDTGITLAQMEQETGTGIVAERLRAGDFVQATASDGVGLYVVGVSGQAASVSLSIVALAAPSASFWR